MGRPLKKHGELETRERLLDAAEEEFAARGLEGARLAEIAARCGITRPSLLYHFGSKEDLYAATVSRAFLGLAEVLAAAMASEGGVDEKLATIVLGYETLIEQNDHLGRLIVREMVASDGPGREAVITYSAPLLDGVVEFLELHRGRGVRDDAPVRAVLMQGISDILLRKASGAALRAAFWGAESHTWPMVRGALIDDEALAAARRAAQKPVARSA